MARTPSTMLNLGTKAPAFDLPDTEGNKHRPETLIGKNGLLLVFICNHCPYVIHLIEHFSKTASQFQADGLGVAAINSNDVLAYPDDSPEKMKTFASEYKFSFPYLFDELQTSARDYRAACTPDFFLFDSEQKLVYRGQYDDSRPQNEEAVSGASLIDAVDHLLQKKPLPDLQKPSLGCNIKWKPGNEPEYFLGAR